MTPSVKNILSFDDLIQDFRTKNKKSGEKLTKYNLLQKAMIHPISRFHKFTTEKLIFFRLTESYLKKQNSNKKQYFLIMKSNLITNFQ